MFDDYIDKAMHIFDFQNKTNQIDKTSCYLFGKKVDILVLTDRLIGCAKGLELCLMRYSDITVHIIDDTTEVKNITIIPDFIIFVGYLKNKIKYKISEHVKKLNPDAVSILYSRIDICSLYEKEQYKIDVCFDRDLPISEFVEYLRGIHKNDKTQTEVLQNEKINLIYSSLKKMSEFYLDIFDLIFYKKYIMAKTACILEIPIKKLYEYRGEELL